MNPKSVEVFSYAGEGYRPLLIRPGWQVAHLNDRADLHADTLGQIERHDATDEVFVLIRGEAQLVIAQAEGGGRLSFERVVMEPGIIYNVPCGVWHAIVTTPGMQVVIVEKDGTHEQGVVHRDLDAGETARLRACLERGLSCAP